MSFTPIPFVKAKATPEDIEAMADKLSPAIARAVAQMLQQASDEVDLDALAAALEAGDVNQVFAVINAAMSKVGQAGAMAALQDGAWAGGALAAALIRPQLRGVEFHFNRLEPRLIDWLKGYDLNLIREINNNTKEGIRAALTDGMTAGQNPRKQAVQLKQIVGLTDRQAKAVLNYRKELETFHTRKGAGGFKLGGKIDRVNGHQVFKPGEDGKPKDGITERRLRDFRYDGTLSGAMKSGKPIAPEKIDKMVEAYANKYRKYRAQNIARTESMRTLNMGVQEGWRQAIVAGKVSENLLRRYWKVASDERTCPVCKPIPGMNPEGLTFAGTFATPKGPIFLPPMHPSCRCHVWIKMLEPEQLQKRHHNQPPRSLRL